MPSAEEQRHIDITRTYLAAVDAFDADAVEPRPGVLSTGEATVQRGASGGSSTVKVEPRPGVLSTRIVPPIMAQSV